MQQYINCIAHVTSDGSLLIGNERAAMFDCGMLFCARDTIRNAEAALGGRPLDFLFATHTHYDHIGALPALRERWPELKLVTSQVGAETLLKATPRRVIRELSLAAAASFASSLDPAGLAYDDGAFHADMIVKEGDCVDLGGCTVEGIETPGHTRDTLSYFIPELELLISSESVGVLLNDGEVYPSYLTSYADTVAAIEKCRRLPYKHLSVPHRGLIGDEQAASYFEKAMRTAVSCHDMIIAMHKNGSGDEEILERFHELYFNDAVAAVQPEVAFTINARATIACTLRELG